MGLILEENGEGTAGTYVVDVHLTLLTAVKRGPIGAAKPLAQKKRAVAIRVANECCILSSGEASKSDHNVEIDEMVKRRAMERK